MLDARAPPDATRSTAMERIFNGLSLIQRDGQCGNSRARARSRAGAQHTNARTNFFDFDADTIYLIAFS